MSIYIVQAGDYPALLAEKYGPGPRAWVELLKLNPGITKSFYQGMSIRFPSGWKKPPRHKCRYPLGLTPTGTKATCPFCYTSSPRDELNRCGWCGAPEGELP